MLQYTKMTREQEFLLQCLRAYVNGESVKEIDVDLDKLYTISKAHNLAPTVFSVIKANHNAKAQKEAYSSFEDSFYEAITRYDMQKNAITELNDILNAQKVPHIFFKGSQIKELYPIPELRLMGDIDMLIPQNKRDTVKHILVDNGYELLNSNGPVYDYKKNDVLIEMHTKIISGKVGNADAEGYFENAIEKGVFDSFNGEFEPSYHFEYLITHLAHHFWFYGAGAKLILDLAIMLKKYDINIEKVINDLAEIKLDKFAKLMLTITYKWFGVGADYDMDTAKSEEFLLNFGAFGNLNRNKSAVIKRKALEEGKKTDFSAKLGLLFPSYKKMKSIPYMTFMEGRPYLLGIGWIYRIVYNLKNRKEFVNETTTALGSEETTASAKEELEYFEEIGLI